MEDADIESKCLAWAAIILGYDCSDNIWSTAASVHKYFENPENPFKNCELVNSISLNSFKYGIQDLLLRGIVDKLFPNLLTFERSRDEGTIVCGAFNICKIFKFSFLGDVRPFLCTDLTEFSLKLVNLSQLLQNIYNKSHICGNKAHVELDNNCLTDLLSITTRTIVDAVSTADNSFPSITPRESKQHYNGNIGLIFEESRDDGQGEVLPLKPKANIMVRKSSKVGLINNSNTVVLSKLNNRNRINDKKTHKKTIKTSTTAGVNNRIKTPSSFTKLVQQHLLADGSIVTIKRVGLSLMIVDTKEHKNNNNSNQMIVRTRYNRHNSNTKISVQKVSIASLRAEKKALKQQVDRLTAKLLSVEDELDAACTIIKTSQEELDKTNGKIQEHVASLSVSELLHKAVNKGGHYFASIHDRKQLSVSAASFLAQLVSVSLVSREKLCQTISFVISMLFGKESDVFIKDALYSNTTYSKHLTRLDTLIQANLASSFTDRSSTRYDLNMGSNLMIDASNKKKKNTVLKLYTFRGLDNKIRLRALTTDRSVTKKGAGGASLTYESLVNNLTERAVPWFLSSSCDKFGRAELIIVMKKIDELSLRDDIRDSLVIKSTVQVGLTYKFYGKGLREHRVIGCIMHEGECIFSPLNEMLCQEQGLQNEATTAQGEFRTSYFMSKLAEMFAALVILSVGGDINKIKDCPAAIRCVYGEICQTRWLSQERQSKKLYELLLIPASDTLVDLVKDYYIKANCIDEWNEIIPFCNCVGPVRKPSHLILSFLYIINHSPGGRSGDAYVYGWRIVSFLMSPYHRAALSVLSEIFTKHLKLAEFADSCSLINSEQQEVISARALELIPYKRKLLSDIYTLADDWGAGFTTAVEDIHAEEEEAFKLGLIEEANELSQFYDSHISEAVDKMLVKALGYLQDDLLNLGTIMLALADPYLSAATALGILEGLRHHNVIKTVIDANVCCEITRLAQQFHQSYCNEQDAVDYEAESWQYHDSKRPFPEYTYKEYRLKVKDLLAKSSLNEIEGFINSCALNNEYIWHELLLLADNGLHTLIDENNLNISADQDCYSGDKMWPIFSTAYPCLSECLYINYSFVSITTTELELTFSKSNDLTHKNNSSITTSENISFAVNLRSNILNGIDTFKLRHQQHPASNNNDTHRPAKRKRLLRSKQALQQYSKILQDHTQKAIVSMSFAEESSLNHGRDSSLETSMSRAPSPSSTALPVIHAVPTISSLNKVNKKRKADTQVLFPHTLREMQSNEKLGNDLIDSGMIIDGIHDYTDAVKTRSSKFRARMSDQEKELWEEVKKLNAGEIRSQLISAYSQEEEGIKKCKFNRAKGQPRGYKTLKAQWVIHKMYQLGMINARIPITE